MTSPSSFGSLSDLKIIDLTQMLAGPYGTMMFSDHGAEVIKIESPAGDMTRDAGPFREDDTLGLLGGYFQSIDRNKKSVCLDLKTEGGKAALRALVKDADAIVENFRPGVMERLGLGYEALREINPRLVYGALSGFGNKRTGASPYGEWPAFDVVAQAMGGIMALTGPNEFTPTKIGPGVGDIIPGMFLAFGLLSAIHEARRSGQGQFVDVSMVDCILAVCERMVWQHSVQGIVPGPEGNHHPFLCPFGMFPARDGWITLGAHQDEFFRKLAGLVDAPHLADDPRFLTFPDRRTHRIALIEELSVFTKALTKAELTERLGGKIPFGPVLNISEIEESPHFAAREMIVDIEQPGASGPIRIVGVPVKHTRTPGKVANRAPFLGEHTAHYLSIAGLSEDEIATCLALIPERSKPDHVVG